MPGVLPDITLFSTADWDNPFWTNKQHMAMQFARHGYRVLYVDSLGLRQPTLAGCDLKRMFGRLRKAFPSPRRVWSTIWRASPLVIPLHRWAAVRRSNDALLKATLRWHMARLKFDNPLIWTYNPLLSCLISQLPHRGVIYHCVDDLRFAPGIDATAINEAKRKVLLSMEACLDFTAAWYDVYLRGASVEKIGSSTSEMEITLRRSLRSGRLSGRSW